MGRVRRFPRADGRHVTLDPIKRGGLGIEHSPPLTDLGGFDLEAGPVENAGGQRPAAIGRLRGPR
jgi:hypothetical protein